MVLLLIVITVAALAVTYNTGYSKGRFDARGVALPPPKEDNMTEFYGFHRTLPPTRKSGTFTQRRG